MKTNLILGMFAAAGLLLATSCQRDELDANLESGGAATVSFSISLESGAQTRTISDGTTVDQLVYAVYDASGNLLQNITAPTGSTNTDGIFTTDSDPFTDLTANIELSLTKKQTYTVVFWAQKCSTSYYTTTDLKAVQVSYTGNNNDESRDAFYAAEKVTVTGSGTVPVTLKRPFAQINVGVTEADWDAAVASGVTITNSSVTIDDAATTINLLTGAVSGSEKVEYTSNTIPASQNTGADSSEEKLSVNSTDYKWLSMSYILVDNTTDATASATVDASFAFTPSTGNDVTLELTNIPVQRNYRTNIIGKILTGDIDFDIVIDNDFEADTADKTIELWDGKTLTAVTEVDNVYSVSTASELAWIAAQVNGTSSSSSSKAAPLTRADATTNNNFAGKTIKLTQDVYLNNQPWTPIGTLPEGENVKDNQTDYPTYSFQGTFDGGGHTVYGLNASSNNATGLFGAVYGKVVIKNVTVDGAAITSNRYAGVIAGYYNGSGNTETHLTIYNCHVKDATVKVTPEWLESSSEYDNGDKAGGIMGHMICYNSQDTTSITNCSVTNATISAYRDLGGIIGNANGGSYITGISNNTVTNVTLQVDLTTTYTISSGYNVGEILGRNDDTNVTLSNNTATGVTIEYITNGVEDATSLQAALSDETVTNIIISEDLDLTNAGNLTVTGDKTIELGDDVTLYVGGTNIFTLIYVSSSNSSLTIIGGTITNATPSSSQSARIARNSTEETTEETTESTNTISDTGGAKTLFIVDDGGSLYLDGVTLINDMDYHQNGTATFTDKNGDTQTLRSAAINYLGDANLTIKNSKIYSGMFTVRGYQTNSGNVLLENSYFESNSSNKYGTYAYAAVLFGSKIEVNDCTVKGIQGALSIAECTDAVVNGGTYYTENSDGRKDAFYPLYITEASTVTVTGGEFSSPNDWSGGLAIGGTSSIVSGDNDNEEIPGTLILQGGKFSGKPYNHVCLTVYDPADGYEWKEISETTDYGATLVWEIVKTESADEGEVTTEDENVEDDD